MTIVRRLDPSGDITFGHGAANYAQRSEACAQNVRTRLLTIFSEWFLDTSAGVPYIGQVFSDPASLPMAEATIKQIILQTTDVQTLDNFVISLDHVTREASVSCIATTIYNDVLNIQVVL